MDFLNAGATRPATDALRAARLGAANALVRQTLARHGLLPGGTEGRIPPPGDLHQTISDALARAGLAPGGPLTARGPGSAVPVPEGPISERAASPAAAAAGSSGPMCPPRRARGSPGSS